MGTTVGADLYVRPKRVASAQTKLYTTQFMGTTVGADLYALPKRVASAQTKLYTTQFMGTKTKWRVAVELLQ